MRKYLRKYVSKIMKKYGTIAIVKKILTSQTIKECESEELDNF